MSEENKTELDNNVSNQNSTDVLKPEAINTQETDDNTKQLEDVVKERKEEERHFPDFLDNADTVDYDEQAKLSKYKRQVNSKSRTEQYQGLIYATGTELSTYSIDHKYVQMLKMEIADTHEPIYVPRIEAGTNYRHMTNIIGHTEKIAIRSFYEVPGNASRDEADKKYIAIGSIGLAEEIVYEGLKEEMDLDPEEAKSKARTGIVTQVVDRPNLKMVFFDYLGVSVGMLEKDFHYRSFKNPLKKDAYIGKKFQFVINDIKQMDYADVPSVKKDMENGVDAPKGTRYMLHVSRLPFLENPNEQVRKLYDRQSFFTANIVRVHPITGIIVEIAAGWWVKGFKSESLPFEPTLQDELQHTEVTVRINWLDFDSHKGQVYIIGFPHGLAKSEGIDAAMDE